MFATLPATANLEMPAVTEPTWMTRELPVLLAIHDAEGRRSRPGAKLDVDHAAFAVDRDVYAQAIHDLMPDYVDAELVPRRGRISHVLVYGLTPAGRRAIGQWPSPYEQLLGALGDLAAEADPSARPGVERLVDRVRSAGAVRAAGVLAELSR